MGSDLAGEVSLRAAVPADAGAIAAILRASLASHAWMPQVHTPAEDLAFIREKVLPQHDVTVAEAGGTIVGFIAVGGNWIDQFYIDPAWTGRGIGARLLRKATQDLASVKLYCFQANQGARRFYERHGFRAEAFTNGSGNQEGLPDALYVCRR